jgi:hypothetical protein
VERLKSGTGTSELSDAWAAGRAAATAGLEMLGDVLPRLVLVYTSVRYDLTELLAGIRSVTGETPSAGMTSSGHFAGNGVTGPGQGVAVLVLGGGEYRFGVASAQGMLAEPEAVGASLARRAKAAAHRPGESAGPAHAAMLLFTNGIGGDQQAVITGIHRVFGASVPVVGGAAADDRKMLRTSVFCNGEVLNDAAVGIWIGSPRPLSVASAHGWMPVGLPLLITKSEGAVIHEIDGRPAVEVFNDPDQAIYSLGVIEPDGGHLLRAVVLTPNGSVIAFTPIPAFSAVQVMAADPGMLMAVVDGVVAKSLSYGDESVLLAFDCVGRMDTFGDDYPDEIYRMMKMAPETCCFGCYTYGEFARAKGVSGVHNATLTALAL